METPTTITYVATLFIHRAPCSPDLGYVMYAPNSHNIVSGSYVALRLTNTPSDLSFGAQVGSIIGLYGSFTVIELTASGLPRLQYIAILGHWIVRERFTWDPWYYIWLGGIVLEDRFVPLQPMMWGEQRRNVEASSGDNGDAEGSG